MHRIRLDIEISVLIVLQFKNGVFVRTLSLTSGYKTRTVTSCIDCSPGEHEEMPWSRRAAADIIER